MKYSFLLFVFFSISISAQEMNNQKLSEIIEKVSDSIQGENGNWQFMIGNVLFYCITDENYNRMRIISPIVEVKKMNQELMYNSLIANFHTALDVKYAISDAILWSAFIHPLKELTSHQIEDAISQVYNANRTFGSTFSSTNLVFPGNISEEEEKEPEEKERNDSQKKI